MDKNNNDSTIKIDDNNNEIKKNRRNKKELFKIEREEIINKIIEIMKIKENNYKIINDDFISNIELKNYIIENIDSIKKYYAFSKIGYFTCHHHGYDKNEFTLAKAIFKNHGYTIVSKKKTLEINGIKKKYKELYFIL